MGRDAQGTMGNGNKKDFPRVELRTLRQEDCELKASLGHRAVVLNQQVTITLG